MGNPHLGDNVGNAVNGVTHRVGNAVNGVAHHVLGGGGNRLPDVGNGLP